MVFVRVVVAASGMSPGTAVVAWVVGELLEARRRHYSSSSRAVVEELRSSRDMDRRATCRGATMEELHSNSSGVAMVGLRGSRDPGLHSSGSSRSSPPLGIQCLQRHTPRGIATTALGGSSSSSRHSSNGRDRPTRMVRRRRMVVLRLFLHLRRLRRLLTLMFFRRGMLLVSSIVVLVASMIVGGTQIIFRRSLPRRLASQWVGCISVNDAVGSATRLRIATRAGVSRVIATFAVTMGTQPVVAVCAVANRVASQVVIRTPTWSLRRPPAPVPLPRPLSAF